MNDGINTLPFGHPLLEKYIYLHNNKTFDTGLYQQDDIILKKVKAEEKIYYESRPLYLQKKLYETALIEGNKLKTSFRKAITESKFLY